MADDDLLAPPSQMPPPAPVLPVPGRAPATTSVGRRRAAAGAVGCSYYDGRSPEAVGRRRRSEELDLGNRVLEENGRLEEDQKLLKDSGRARPKKWKRISESELGTVRTDIQCLHRWTKVIKPGLNKGPWLQQEDDLVRAEVQRMKRESAEGVVKWAQMPRASTASQAMGVRGSASSVGSGGSTI